MCTHTDTGVLIQIQVNGGICAHKHIIYTVCTVCKSTQALTHIYFHNHTSHVVHADVNEHTLRTHTHINTTLHAHSPDTPPIPLRRI